MMHKKIVGSVFITFVVKCAFLFASDKSNIALNTTVEPFTEPQPNQTLSLKEEKTLNNKSIMQEETIDNLKTSNITKEGKTKEVLLGKNKTGIVPVKVNETSTRGSQVYLINEEDANNSNDTTEESFFETEISYVLDTLSTVEDDNITLIDPTYTSIAPKNNVITRKDRSEPFLEDFCLCDLHVSVCDVNCCCDTDCSADDKKVFTECSKVWQNLDVHYCTQTEILYRNNTEYILEKTSSGLFCILRDNLSKRHLYKDGKSVENIEEFKQLLPTNIYPWFSNSFEELIIYSSKEFIAGDPVWVISTGVEQVNHWYLPGSLLSSFCDGSIPVKYMINHVSSCVRLVSKNCEQDLALTTTTYYQKFYILKSLKLFLKEKDNINTNTTESKQILCQDSDTCIPVIPTGHYHCWNTDGLPDSCFFPAPSFNESSKICHNVVTAVTFNIVHNGIHGISNASVSFEMASVEVGDTENSVSQKLEVKFLWETNSNVTFKRSGNPGYIVGEPVLAGHLDTVLDAHGLSYPVILLDSDRNNWLTILRSSADSRCDSIQSQLPIQFAEDLHSGCVLHLNSTALRTKGCQYIQKMVMLALVGDNPPEYVGKFGNSDRHDINDWLKIQEEGKPTEEILELTPDGVCPKVVLGLNIYVLFANAGSIASPQSIIIGVLFKFTEPKEVKIHCFGVYCSSVTEEWTQVVRVTTSVMFVDVSEQSSPYYVHPPVLEARLPHDFFYPFLSTGNNKQSQLPGILVFWLLFLFTRR
ncbi:tectonic-1-like [Tachypleus tridentatus]|uniref:tectonic-1-like n=1 Tax=Tachypleus tridentatus TaxID=6853 RepID=UPI003FD0186F